jgi:hypothetical protein
MSFLLLFGAMLCALWLVLPLLVEVT